MGKEEKKVRKGMKEGGKKRREETGYKSKDEKRCSGKCEQGERQKDRRGSTWWTAGLGHRGQARKVLTKS